MMFDKVTHDAGQAEVPTHVDRHLDDDPTTPLDTNRVRWVVVATIAFWWMVYFVLRHVF